ncbi:hypothetical protein M427DRAFT_34185 [Gonapodya prolifera JEL478]|uniref:Uncharacterized protein n=1 Tax=Gonapodya prolifera (strain JEL478) TaxID=1344416 RepID=A0A139A8T9_GONPJ|nr:hypothetical protein M427DRAFT_34185 [Gonapodya prolifera JEL478]|eukprot:KXS13124.1 hypothetical protein M427DRAFT_34185 [Gonapodya prolifera JEL478]
MSDNLNQDVPPVEEIPTDRSDTTGTKHSDPTVEGASGEDELNEDGGKSSSPKGKEVTQDSVLQVESSEEELSPSSRSTRRTVSSKRSRTTEPKSAKKVQLAIEADVAEKAKKLERMIKTLRKIGKGTADKTEVSELQTELTVLLPAPKDDVSMSDAEPVVAKDDQMSEDNNDDGNLPTSMARFFKSEFDYKTCIFEMRDPFRSMRNIVNEVRHLRPRMSDQNLMKVIRKCLPDGIKQHLLDGNCPATNYDASFPDTPATLDQLQRYIFAYCNTLAMVKFFQKTKVTPSWPHDEKGNPISAEEFLQMLLLWHAGQLQFWSGRYPTTEPSQETIQTAAIASFRYAIGETNQRKLEKMSDMMRIPLTTVENYKRLVHHITPQTDTPKYFPVGKGNNAGKSSEDSGKALKCARTPPPSDDEGDNGKRSQRDNFRRSGGGG